VLILRDIWPVRYLVGGLIIAQSIVSARVIESGEVYEVAAKLAVKAATEGVNGMKC
jgi:hypothetical protein